MNIYEFLSGVLKKTTLFGLMLCSAALANDRSCSKFEGEWNVVKEGEVKGTMKIHFDEFCTQFCFGPGEPASEFERLRTRCYSPNETLNRVTTLTLDGVSRIRTHAGSVLWIGDEAKTGIEINVTNLFARKGDLHKTVVSSDRFELNEEEGRIIYTADHRRQRTSSLLSDQEVILSSMQV